MSKLEDQILNTNTNNFLFYIDLQYKITSLNICFDVN